MESLPWNLLSFLLLFSFSQSSCFQNVVHEPLEVPKTLAEVHKVKAIFIIILNIICIFVVLTFTLMVQKQQWKTAGALAQTKAVRTDLFTVLCDGMKRTHRALCSLSNPSDGLEEKPLCDCCKQN